MALLQPGETAVTGQTTHPDSSVLWDAVFARNEQGRRRLLAYVASYDVADFFVRCLNQAPGLVLDLHESVKSGKDYRDAVNRAETFLDKLSVEDLER